MLTYTWIPLGAKVNASEVITLGSSQLLSEAIDEAWQAAVTAAGGVEENASLDAEFKLSGDIEETGPITIEKGMTIQVDLNYKRMERKAGATNTHQGALIHIKSGGSLFLSEGSVRGWSDNAAAEQAEEEFLSNGGARGPIVSVDFGGELECLHVLFSHSENNCGLDSTLGGGGVIHNCGQTHVHRCRFGGAAAAGGAIYNDRGGSLDYQGGGRGAWRAFDLAGTDVMVYVESGFYGCCARTIGAEAQNGTGLGGAIFNAGEARLEGAVFEGCVADGGGGVANDGGTCRLMDCTFESGSAASALQSPESHGDGETETVTGWTGGNLLWNSGTCYVNAVTFCPNQSNRAAADIFVLGYHPLIVGSSDGSGTCAIPAASEGKELTFAGVYYDEGEDWSSGKLYKLGIAGPDNDFRLIDTDTKGGTLQNPQNARIFCDMPLLLDEDGYARLAGTNKIHADMRRYVGHTFILYLASGKTTSGTLSCNLCHITAGNFVTDSENKPLAPLIELITNDTHDRHRLATASPVSDFTNEGGLSEEEEATVPKLRVTLPDGLEPGSYWLVVYEQRPEEEKKAIGFMHINLADTACPLFDVEGVWTVAEGGTQIAPGSDGYYEYDPNTTPVTKFTLSDTSGIPDGLAGGVKILRLRRPGDGNPLSSADVTVTTGTDGEVVTVNYPVTAAGVYEFQAIDYAGNENAVQFKLRHKPAAPPPEQQQAPKSVNIINNNNIQIVNDSGSNSASDAGGNTAGSTNSTSNNNSNSSNQDSSNASENSNNAANGGATSTADGAGTTGGAGTATAEEAAAAAKKKPDKTEFTFYGGKSYSNTTGKITPSKYISKQAFYNAKPGDVLLKARSDSAGESGVSEQELTKEDVIEATKKQEGAIAGVAYQISPISRAIPNVNFAGTAGASERRSPKRRR